MKTREVDVAIIGAGTAGLSAYSTARRQTDNLVLIEKGPVGTTCARVGCMPSKLLIAAADAANAVRGASQFGVGAAAGPQIDGAAVMARVRRLRDDFVQGVIDSLEAYPDDRVMMGEARFVDERTLHIDKELEVRARAVVIATGSSPLIPEPLQPLGDRLLTSDDVFELDDLPKSLAIFGAGSAGLELAQAFHRLGVDIRLFGLDGDVGPLTDPQILDYAKRTFQAEFFFDPDARNVSAERDGEGVAIRQDNGDKASSLTRFDFALAVTGRRPNLDDLGLDRIDAPRDENGAPAYNRYTGQWGEGPLFIVGDANDDVPLLHEAAHEGRLAGENAARYPDLRMQPRKTRLAIVFTSPQIAVVGKSRKDLDATGSDYAAGGVCFEHQGRARVIGEACGHLNIYGERGSGLLLGAEMIAPKAEHLVHLLAWATQRRLTVSEALDLPLYHPVIEEGLRTAFRRLNRNLMMGPGEQPEDIDCGPGD